MPLRRYVDLVAGLDRGEFASEVDTALNEAMKQLAATPSKKAVGKIEVTLTLTYMGGRVDVEPSLKSRLPTPTFGRTPFWDIDGAFSTEHPNQTDMFPRSVPTAADGREIAHDDDGEVIERDSEQAATTAE